MEAVNKKFKISNAKIITENIIIPNGTVLVENGKILGVESSPLSQLDLMKLMPINHLLLQVS